VSHPLERRFVPTWRRLNVLVDSAFSVDAGALILISHVDPDVQGHGTAHKRLDLTRFVLVTAEVCSIPELLSSRSLRQVIAANVSLKSVQRE